VTETRSENKGTASRAGCGTKTRVCITALGQYLASFGGRVRENLWLCHGPSKTSMTLSWTKQNFWLCDGKPVKSCCSHLSANRSADTTDVDLHKHFRHLWNCFGCEHVGTSLLKQEFCGSAYPQYHKVLFYFCWGTNVCVGENTAEQ
jgi:hypothetical protein